VHDAVKHQAWGGPRVISQTYCYIVILLLFAVFKTGCVN
jgi:hypothetical protein